MHNSRKYIDDLFRDGLKGLREKPPVHAWNRLEEGLNAHGTGRRLRFLRLAAASILILIAFGAGYYFAIYNTNQTRDSLSTNEELPQNVPDQQFVSPENAEKNKIAGTEPPLTESYTSTFAESQLQESETTVPVEKNTGSAGITETTKDHTEISSRFASLERSEIQRIDPTNIEILKVSGSGHQPIVLNNKLKTDFPLELYPEFEYPDNSKKSGKKIYNWSVGAQFAPTYSYREISTNYGAGTTGDPSTDENYNAIEDPLLSYAGGFQVDYRVSGNWRLESGVYFSRIGQVNNDALQFKQGNNEYILTAINTSTGGINVAYDRVPENVKRVTTTKDSLNISSVENVTIVQQFDLLEIPFLVKYKMLNRKFSMHVSGGLSPAYLVNNNTYLEMEDRKYDVGDAGNLNTMIVNTSLGVGFEYLITKKLAINLEPTFKYALNPINNNSNFSYHPYYFSWFTGIRLRID